MLPAHVSVFPFARRSSVLFVDGSSAWLLTNGCKHFFPLVTFSSIEIRIHLRFFLSFFLVDQSSVLISYSSRLLCFRIGFIQEAEPVH